ncbi:TrmB family sugar-specific transcriptional regulator [Candidatus Vecturithrix granuli]|uniref:TrmB family sugar-specific transcriptional regulator n=1 Tax=Vecturithrix granuli TaxID=1499967 RepID=A0A081C148_VECG1|nr:TrmB family sugar-specific transcriptional regulator [Candidatus Vecturithrix granuli]
MVLENIITHLELLRFSRIEAQVYVTLVKHSKLNGSQIAKVLNLSRSSVYSALHSLYNRGIVFLLPGESNVYKAQDPDILLETLKNEYIQATNELKDELSRFKFVEVEKEYWNIRGYQNFLLKTKELLLQAELEVYMNTCFDLRIFAEELEKLAKRGVRVIVFTLAAEIDPEGLPVEFYRKFWPDTQCDHQRMMLVVDFKKALIAGSYHGSEVMGTFTENPLLVAIVSEHIHLDVYLLKLQEKYHDPEFFNGILLNSQLERR